MTTTTSTAAAILRPADVDQLFLGPVVADSIAGQVCRLVRTTSRAFRVPRVAEDPSAAWVAEGQEITPSDARLDEIEVTPAKLAGLTIITRELADDSSPEASQVVADGLVRDCARKLDAALFSSQPAPAPPGLTVLNGASGVTTVAAGPAWTNTDPFVAAVFEAATRSATIATWVANPTDARAIATLKESSSSNKGLLSPDPTAPGRSILLGLPLLTSPAVEVGSVWGIDPTRALLVVREEVSIDVDRSAFFTSDRVAVRAVMRAAFAFPQPGAVIRVELDAPTP